MAGDWIKIEMATPDKPEVCQISEELGIDPDAVVGKLVRFWAWCDSQSVNGHGISVTKLFLDRLTHQTGFAQALVSVGWLHSESGAFVIPHFDRHNGKSAKSRALATERKRMSRRDRYKCHAEIVTEPIPEKRREEKRIENKYAGSRVEEKRRPKTASECAEYCFSIGLKSDDGEWLWDKWSGNGFKVGTEDIEDWRAIARAWKHTNVFPSQKGGYQKEGATTPEPRKPSLWSLQQQQDACEKELSELRFPGGCGYARALEGEKLDRANQLARRIKELKREITDFQQ